MIDVEAPLSAILMISALGVSFIGVVSVYTLFIFFCNVIAAGAVVGGI